MLPQVNISFLKERSHMLAQTRSFFAKQGVLEVDCLALSHYATIDVFIEPMELYPTGNTKYFLHTSPEYKMKYLLSKGIGDIYQLSHVFRKGETSKKHSPEFTMLEWYRLGFSFQEMIEETVAVISLFIDYSKRIAYSFYDALHRFANVKTIGLVQLQTALSSWNIPYNATWDEQILLHLVWSEIVEKQFEKNALTIIYDFPASEAALAQVDISQSPPVAKRFELYHNGYELANGYLELQDSNELIRRFQHDNLKRKQLGKESFEMDALLIQTLRDGFPACCGVAVGFDRLVMLKTKTDNIHNILF
ncbi:MAG: EF-P lysine aminoacylase GenX [Chlamydiales bacterium]|nr:EF-P lysine aminoacylase GenX [Chlamydiales bacterium]